MRSPAADHRVHTSGRAAVRGIAALLLVGRWLRLAASVARERRALAALDDRALRDLGIGRNEARRESRRPPWDLPCRRRRRDGC